MEVLPWTCLAIEQVFLNFHIFVQITTKIRNTLRKLFAQRVHRTSCFPNSKPIGCKQIILRILNKTGKTNQTTKRRAFAVTTTRLQYLLARNIMLFQPSLSSSTISMSIMLWMQISYCPGRRIVGGGDFQNFFGLIFLKVTVF